MSDVSAVLPAPGRCRAVGGWWTEGSVAPTSTGDSGSETPRRGNP